MKPIFIILSGLVALSQALPSAELDSVDQLANTTSSTEARTVISEADHELVSRAKLAADEWEIKFYDNVGCKSRFGKVRIHKKVGKGPHACVNLPQAALGSKFQGPDGIESILYFGADCSGASINSARPGCSPRTAGILSYEIGNI